VDGSSTGVGSVLRLHLASLFAAQLFDYGTFTLMVDRHGIAAELNPLVAQGFVVFGLPFLALAKGALVMLVASIVVVIARRANTQRSLPVLATAVTIIAVLAGLVGGISNTAAA
jgi:hypothetical protein